MSLPGSPGWNAIFACFLFLLSSGSFTVSAATTSVPSGTIVNSYARVVSISSTSIQVSSSVGFTVNSRALIVQMQGASVDRQDGTTHGQITGYGAAGRFEYVKIIAISGNFVTVEVAPTVTFTTSGAVQMVSVPVYDSLTINQNIVPKAGDGQTGGVVALDVVGTLTLNSDVDATGRGFRGGALAISTAYDNCASDQINYTGPVQAGTGNKGEGIAASASAHAARRGRNSNGGGGGNITDAGGGGGANIGTGGRGGRELDICDEGLNFGGIGGQGLDYSANNRLFMGGGAGSGSEVSQAATGGSRAGGGIIFVRAGTMVGGGGRMIADGLFAVQDNFNGADGGGAGGAIAISVTGSLTGFPVVRVSGGNGGDEANTSYAHGTGGGGGGGAIRIFGATCESIAPVVAGGAAGTSVLGSNVSDSNLGATDGGPGDCQGNYSALGKTSPVVAAKLNIFKTSSVYTFGDNNTGFATPGADIIYTIVVRNIGDGPAGQDSIFIIDQLPGNLTFYNDDLDNGGPDTFPGDNPVAFVDNGSGLSLNYANDVAFSNLSTAPESFSSCSYSPISGYDPAVTHICINPKGVFAQPMPTSEFTVALRVKID